MIKSLHPDREKKPDPFYREVFERLDRLSKLQLIICPDSEFHEKESLFYKPAEHKRVYELLSHGVTYLDSWTLLRFEIGEQLENWLNGTSMGETALTKQRMVHGKIDGLQERLIISINSQRLESEKTELKQSKIDTFSALKQAINRWERERGKDFQFWYGEEIGQWPQLIVDGYKNHFERSMKVMFGLDPDPLGLLPTPFYLIFGEISGTLKQKFGEGEEFKKRIQEFMRPENFEKVPFVHIYSMLMATLAAGLSSGHMKKAKIRPSVFSDVFMISSLLPFCDAIFLEKQMAGFLRNKPFSQVIQRMPRVFSLSNKQEFLAYLESIEKSASPTHMAAVSEVYGDDWGRPFISVLDEYKSKRD